MPPKDDMLLKIVRKNLQFSFQIHMFPLALDINKVHSSKNIIL